MSYVNEIFQYFYYFFMNFVLAYSRYTFVISCNFNRTFCLFSYKHNTIEPWCQTYSWAFRVLSISSIAPITTTEFECILWALFTFFDKDYSMSFFTAWIIASKRRNIDWCTYLFFAFFAESRSLCTKDTWIAAFICSEKKS